MTDRRPIPGADGYEASSSGEIFSVTRKIATSVGTQTHKGKKLSLKPGKRGYMSFVVRKNGKPKNIAVHHAVMRAFVGPRPEGMQCAHLNGVRTDNRLENLAYVTPKENNKHKKQHGTQPLGRRIWNAKLTERQVRWMRARRGQFTYQELADFYGVAMTTIAGAMNRHNWKHLK